MSTTTTTTRYCIRGRCQQQQGTVSVEDVDGLSSGHLDVLHVVALPGLESLPFPSSDQHHARLASVAVNLETRRIRELLCTHRHTEKKTHEDTQTCKHTQTHIRGNTHTKPKRETSDFETTLVHWPKYFICSRGKLGFDGWSMVMIINRTLHLRWMPVYIELVHILWRPIQHNRHPVMSCRVHPSVQVCLHPYQLADGAMMPGWHSTVPHLPCHIGMQPKKIFHPSQCIDTIKNRGRKPKWCCRRPMPIYVFGCAMKLQRRDDSNVICKQAGRWTKGAISCALVVGKIHL